MAKQEDPEENRKYIKLRCILESELLVNINNSSETIQLRLKNVALPVGRFP